MKTYEYQIEVQSIAETVIDEVMEHGGELSDLVHENVDGHEWIIYTAYHQQIIDNCSYNDAYLDCYGHEDLGRIMTEQGLDAVIQTRAFFALDHDVREAVEELRQSEIEELMSEIESLEERVERAEGRIEKYENEMEDMEEEMPNLYTMEKSKFEQLIKEREADIDLDNGKIEELKEKLERLES